METRKLTCIRCPRGCTVTVTLADDGTITSVTGNSCMRGDKYARDEVTHPVRVVTTTVPVVGSATEKMVSVKTAGESSTLCEPSRTSRQPHRFTLATSFSPMSPEPE